MVGKIRTRPFWWLEPVAAALFASACAFASAELLYARGFGSGVVEASAFASLLAFVLVNSGLQRLAVGGEPMRPTFRPEPLVFAGSEVPGFEAETAHQAEPCADELLLTEVHRPKVPPATCAPADRAGEELLLDELALELAPDSRVVPLFDSKPMPTAGQLKARIDDHLGSAISNSAPPDASGALHQALADLRRSLR